jgi:hypothetical protein
LLRRCALFRRQCRKVLLTRLQRGDILAGRAFPVHAEPEHRDYNAAHTRNYVLGGLPTLLVGEFLDLDIVGFDFGCELRTTGGLIPRVYCSDGLRIASSMTCPIARDAVDF